MPAQQVIEQPLPVAKGMAVPGEMEDVELTQPVRASYFVLPTPAALAISFDTRYRK